MIIKSGDHSVLLSCQGGSILQWQWKDHLILGPTRMEKVDSEFKLRGMTHWCYPKFGQAADLPQHGFLRESVMEPRRLSANFAEFRKSFKAIDGFPWESRALIEHVISLDAPEDYDHLTSAISITNISYRREHETIGDMPILPALHPYFNTEKGAAITIGQKQIIFGKPVSISRDNPIVVYFSFGRVTMKPSDNCEWLVVWSDKASSYLCVEPIFFGEPSSFRDNDMGKLIKSGQTVACEVIFFFEPA